MTVYRIAREPYAGDLSGEGARMYGGRWNTAGTAVVYGAETRALAALEFLVHCGDMTLLPPMVLITVELPDETSETLTPSSLPAGWNSPVPSAVAQRMGDDWARRRESLVLRVPSVVMSEEYNLVINASHRAITKARIIGTRPFRFDLRLETASGA